MRRLKRALFNYAMHEEYISEYGFDRTGLTRCCFYFSTHNSKPNEYHRFIITDVLPLYSNDAIEEVIKEVNKKVRELEQKGE